MILELFFCSPKAIYYMCILRKFHVLKNVNYMKHKLGLEFLRISVNTLPRIEEHWHQEGEQK